MYQLSVPLDLDLGLDLGIAVTAPTCAAGATILCPVVSAPDEVKGSARLEGVASLAERAEQFDQAGFVVKAFDHRLVVGGDGLELGVREGEHAVCRPSSLPGSWPWL
jgi:hypothetical protein